jgi:hypothetical protein
LSVSKRGNRKRSSSRHHSGSSESIASPPARPVNPR